MYYIILLLGITLLSQSCRKDDSNNNNGDGSSSGVKFDNSARVNANITGTLIDESGDPISGATVKVAGHTFISDDDGFFYFSDISIPKNATCVLAKMPGYFDGVRNLSITADQNHVVQIMMLKLGTATTIDPATGGIVTFAGGGSIDFRPNSIVDEATGQKYLAPVSVYAKWIDPTSDEFAVAVPGGLRGINTGGVERYLTSYGMLAVELKGVHGQKLNLENDMTATIKMPIPSSLQSAAPSSIPLWHLAYSDAMWMEQGSATKQGNQYVGEVSHFSFWNCDAPMNLVQYTVKITDENGNPLQGVRVKLHAASLNTQGYGITNAAGVTTGSIPANTSFDVSYQFVHCGMSSVFNSLGSFATSSSSVTQTYMINTSSSATTTISGSIHDCSGNILANTPVKIKINSHTNSLSTDNAGNFSFTTTCIQSSTPVTITGYDVNITESGSLITTIVPNTVNNVGMVQACGTPLMYINWDVTIPPSTTPTSYSIIEPDGNFVQSYFGNSMTYISGLEKNTPSGDKTAVMVIDGPQNDIGPHTLVAFTDQIDSLSLSSAPANITQYGAVGDRIIGTFTVTGSSSNGPYSGATIHCNFNVERQQ